MPDATDGTPYDIWVTQSKADDLTARMTAEYEMVTLYDRMGLPQRVRGSNVAGMLAKTGDDEKPVFFGSVPA